MHRALARPFAAAAIFALLAVLTAPLSAQCQTYWLPGAGEVGIFGWAHASVHWDPDGSGPATPVVVIGGDFTVAAPVHANDLAVFDPADGSFTALGAGTDGYVTALAALPNGDLVVGGYFSTIDNTAADNLACWDGTAWAPLGGGVDSEVSALLVQPNGDLVVGGYFLNAGATLCNRLARWDGTSWHAYGSGVSQSGARVASLTHDSAGDLVIGGTFDQVDGQTAASLARWDGATWHAYGSGVAGGVLSLLAEANGALVVGGVFLTAGGISAYNIAHWDGNSWQAYGSGLRNGFYPQAPVRALRYYNGELVAGGGFTTSGPAAVGMVGRWNGSSWQQLGTGLVGAFGGGPHTMLELGNGDLLVAGRFGTAGSATVSHIAAWNGSAWSRLSGGFDQGLLTVAGGANGDVYAGGHFSSFGITPANRIARWDGSAWHALGNGLNGECRDIVELANGDVVAAGTFTQAGGAPADYLARWDGAAWHGFGSGPNGVVEALQRMPNGDLVAGGSFTTIDGVAAQHIARWDGNAWHPFGPGMPLTVDALAVLPSGELIADGETASPGPLRRWDGTAWQLLGTPSNSAISGPIYALEVMPNGDLVVGGAFLTTGGVSARNISRWDGQGWHPFGSGLTGSTYTAVRALLALPDGDLLAAGSFNNSGGNSMDNIARWDGSGWQEFNHGANGVTHDLAMTRDGLLVAGGVFSRVSNVNSASFARATTTCLATAQLVGTACNSSVGPMNLTIEELPWTGGTFRTRCDGFAPGALGFGLLGFTSPGVALSSLHATGVPGCDLLADQDAVLFVLPVAGEVSCAFAMPASMAFAGYPIHHQVLQLELGAGGQITRLVGSSGVDLVLGTF